MFLETGYALGLEYSCEVDKCEQIELVTTWFDDAAKAEWKERLKLGEGGSELCSRADKIWTAKSYSKAASQHSQHSSIAAERASDDTQ